MQTSSLPYYIQFDLQDSVCTASEVCTHASQIEALRDSVQALQGLVATQSTALATQSTVVAEQSTRIDQVPIPWVVLGRGSKIDQHMTVATCTDAHDSWLSMRCSQARAFLPVTPPSATRIIAGCTSHVQLETAGTARSDRMDAELARLIAHDLSLCNASCLAGSCGNYSDSSGHGVRCVCDPGKPHLNAVAGVVGRWRMDRGWAHAPHLIVGAVSPADRGQG